MSVEPQTGGTNPAAAEKKRLGLALFFALTGLAVIGIAFSYPVMSIPDVFLAAVMVFGAVMLGRGAAGPLTRALLLAASGAAVYGGAWHLGIITDPSIPVPHYRQVINLIDRVYGWSMIPVGMIGAGWLAWVERDAGRAEPTLETTSTAGNSLRRAFGMVEVGFGLFFSVLAWGGRSIADASLGAGLIVGGCLFWNRPAGILPRSLLFAATGSMFYLGLLNMTTEAFRAGWNNHRYFSVLHFTFGAFMTLYGVLSVCVLRKGSVECRD